MAHNSAAPILAVWNGVEVDLNDDSIRICRDMNIATTLGHLKEKLFTLYNGNKKNTSSKFHYN